MQEVFKIKCNKHNQFVNVTYQVRNYSLSVGYCEKHCIDCPFEMSEKILGAVLRDFQSKYHRGDNVESN